MCHSFQLRVGGLFVSICFVYIIDVDCHSSSIDTISSALSGYSQLIVNGKIVVRKDNVTGKLNVEGEISVTILGKFSLTFDAISPHRLTSTIINVFVLQALYAMTSSQSDRSSKTTLLQYELISTAPTPT